MNAKLQSTEAASGSHGDRPGGLLAWQWDLYTRGHQTRRNLLIHILAVPLFLASSVGLVIGLALGQPLALLLLLPMVAAVAAQGRGHRGEPVAAVPFRSPFDGMARLFVEQCITFPRFVLSGGWGRAWRQTASERRSGRDGA